MPQPDGTFLYFDQASRRPNWFDGHNYRAGLDYFASKKSTFGVLVTGFYNDFNQDNALNRTVISDAAGDVTQKANTWVTVNNGWRNVTGNLNYKYDLDGKGREFTATWTTPASTASRTTTCSPGTSTPPTRKPSCRRKSATTCLRPSTSGR
jgi:uncharacterized protein YaiE (UPF0345 family)